MPTAYLGLGSNVGDPPTNLARAIEMLAGKGLIVRAVSEGYRTQPVGEILEGAIKTVLSGPRVLVGGALLVVGGVQAIVLVTVWLLAGNIDFTDASVTAAEVARLSAAAAVAVLGSWTVSVAMTGLVAAELEEIPAQIERDAIEVFALLHGPASKETQRKSA